MGSETSTLNSTEKDTNSNGSEDSTNSVGSTGLAEYVFIPKTKHKYLTLFHWG